MDTNGDEFKSASGPRIRPSTLFGKADRCLARWNGSHRPEREPANHRRINALDAPNSISRPTVPEMSEEMELEKGRGGIRWRSGCGWDASICYAMPRSAYPTREIVRIRRVCDDATGLLICGLWVR